MKKEELDELCYEEFICRALFVTASSVAEVFVSLYCFEDLKLERATAGVTSAYCTSSDKFTEDTRLYVISENILNAKTLNEKALNKIQERKNGMKKLEELNRLLCQEAKKELEWILQEYKRQETLYEFMEKLQTPKTAQFQEMFQAGLASIGDIVFVNREEQTKRLLNALAKQKHNKFAQHQQNSSEQTIVALGQPYGIGKTTFVYKFRTLADQYSCWDSLRCTDKSLMESLKSAVLFSIDMRHLDFVSSKEWNEQIAEHFRYSWDPNLQNWKGLGITAILEKLKTKLEKCRYLNEMFKVLNSADIPIVVHVDEISAVNNRPDLQIPGRANGKGIAHDLQRITDLWCLLSSALAYKNLFLITSGKFPHLLAISRGILPPHLRENFKPSPTFVEPIYMSALETTHIKELFKSTKFMHNSAMSLFDGLIGLGLTQELEGYFWRQVDRFTAGIPRIVKYLTESLFMKETQADLSSAAGIFKALEAGYLHQKWSDLLYFESKTQPAQQLVSRLILVGAMRVPIPLRAEIVIGGRRYPIVFLLEALSILYEIKGNANKSQDNGELLIKVPYYALMAHQSSYDYFVRWTAALLGQSDVLSKEIVFQEILLQSTALRMISSKGKSLGEAFQCYEKCFFAGYKIDVSNMESCIKLFPAFHLNARKKPKDLSWRTSVKRTLKHEIKKKNLVKIEENIWHYKLPRTMRALKSLLEHKVLEPGKFGRPASYSVGEDAIYILKYDAEAKLIENIAYQHKMHPNNDISWSALQTEIDSVAAIQGRYSTWTVKICLHIIAFGLSAEVKAAVGKGSMLITHGNYKYKHGLLELCESEATLSIPEHMELLIMSEDSIESLVGRDNYDFLRQLNEQIPSAKPSYNGFLDFLLKDPCTSVSADDIFGTLDEQTTPPATTATNVPAALKARDDITYDNIRFDITRCGPGLSIQNNNKILQKTTAGNSWVTAMATKGFSSGIHYFQVQLDDGQANNSVMVGAAVPEFNVSNASYPGQAGTAPSYAYYLANGYRYTATGSPNTSAFGSPASNGDLIGVLLNLDVGTIGFFKNGTFLGTAYVELPAGKTFYPAIALYAGGAQVSAVDVVFPEKKQ